MRPCLSLLMMGVALAVTVFGAAVLLLPAPASGFGWGVDDPLGGVVHAPSSPGAWKVVAADRVGRAASAEDARRIAVLQAVGA